MLRVRDDYDSFLTFSGSEEERFGLFAGIEPDEYLSGETYAVADIS